MIGKYAISFYENLPQVWGTYSSYIQFINIDTEFLSSLDEEEIIKFVDLLMKISLPREAGARETIDPSVLSMDEKNLLITGVIDLVITLLIVPFVILYLINYIDIYRLIALISIIAIYVVIFIPLDIKAIRLVFKHLKRLFLMKKSRK